MAEVIYGTCKHFKGRVGNEWGLCRKRKCQANDRDPNRSCWEPLLTAADLAGSIPDLTGDMSTKEFINYIRGEVGEE